MGDHKRNHFAIEFFTKIPYGYFVIPSIIIILNTLIVMLLIRFYSLYPSFEYKIFFGVNDSEPEKIFLTIFFTRIILIITLAIILKTAENNLNVIYKLKSDIGFLISKKEQVFEFINKDVFGIERRIINYRLIYLAFPVSFTFFYIFKIHSYIPWFYIYPLQIITWGIWWCLIFYGTYSGVIGSNIVLYLFDTESSAVEIKEFKNVRKIITFVKSKINLMRRIINAKIQHKLGKLLEKVTNTNNIIIIYIRKLIKKINCPEKKLRECINGSEEIKFNDTKIEILNPDRLGGLHSVKNLLSAPIIIGISAIFMSLLIVGEMRDQPGALFTNATYYILILMCATIPQYVFSEFLSKHKKTYLVESFRRQKFDNSTNEKLDANYDKMFDMKTTPFNLRYAIEVLFLILSPLIGIYLK
ncbi:Uncharacterised protein [uncultured archaeon]|nr:Uncharacterised protein [uncultured archaeon]